MNVGVVGLEQRWQQRFRTALLGLSDHFRISMVCDATIVRAEQEAQNLHCDFAVGPTELLESAALDALILLDASWYRLWPIELACRLGKPVFCASPLEWDDAHADRLRDLVCTSSLPVMFALAPRLAGPTDHLRELLAHQLGPARMITCTCNQPVPKQGRALSALGPERSLLLGGQGTALIDWCLTLIDSSPVRVQATEVKTAGLTNVVLEFAGGQAAHISFRQGPGLSRAFRLEVHATHGQATAKLPNRIYWTSGDSRNCRRLRRVQPLAQLLLLRFYQAVTERRTPQPNLADAHRALVCWRAAQHCLAEPRCYPVPLEQYGNPCGAA